jgi:hypothetical protein
VSCLALLAVLSANLAQLRIDHARIANLDQLQLSIALQAPVDDVRQRWFGDPALWQPSGTPANTAVEFFDVNGSTQSELIDALDNDGLCQKYGCAPDPAVPNNNTAWALESSRYIDSSSPYCYSPRTLTYHWEQHWILLPRWRPKLGSVKSSLVQRWNALEAVLFTHESGHVRVAEDWLAAENAQAEQLPSCDAAITFWGDPHLFDSLHAAQNAYHAKLRADCRPDVGCIPAGWMGW